MITEELKKKIDRAIKLLKSFDNPNEPVEVAYSGGKDSDVILQLVKESGINYRAIYKNTTIDPAGTIAHAKAMGAEIVRPRNNTTFFRMIAQKGFPSRLHRFCCRELKEYKILNKAVIGVRKAESTKRAKNYNEPTECRYYGSKKEHVEAIYPILEWTNDDVKAFILDRHIQCSPLYYDEDGVFHVERRLGCMCCPLASTKKRIGEFKKYPRMVKAYCRAGQKFLDSHPDSKVAKMYKDIYTWFYRDLFFDRQIDWEESKRNFFGEPDYKKALEDIFKISLP